MLSKSLIDEISKMSREDIRTAWEHMKTRDRRLSEDALLNFNTGDKVVFDSRKRGMQIHGTIEKLNQKTITVKASDGMRWKVSASFLKHA